jgi:hypothetical protein
MDAGRAIAICAAISALIACGRASPEPTPTTRLAQTAYVWQRNWTPAVRDAVAHPPAGIEGLRVLVGANIDDAALVAAHIPITLVLRIEGSRLIEGFTLDEVVGTADSLRGHGVDVVGIEVDHDCATARLAEYAQWLTKAAQVVRRDDHARYRFSITALPTWASSPALIDVANAVDEIVVQVHAVRAPTIFDGNVAWRDLARFAKVLAASRTMSTSDSRLRVALPTYHATIGGVEVRVEPDDVERFVRALEARPIEGVGGVVWFRLPIDGDEQTWSRETFARIVASGRHSSAKARIELVQQGDGRFDVVVSNPSDARVELPAVHVAGSIGDADMVMGYRANGPGRWDAPHRSLAQNERVVVGWIYGKDVSLVD